MSSSLGAVNIGVAVAVETGLLTVVCRDADRKPLRQIAAEVRTMAARAREGKVRPEDIEGSTFSISNLGMYQVEHFIAIINPPEAAILAVGSALQVPVVKDGQIVTRLAHESHPLGRPPRQRRRRSRPLPAGAGALPGGAGAAVVMSLASVGSVKLNKYKGWLLALLPAGLTLFFLSLLPKAIEDNPLALNIPWAPQLGLDFTLRADGLGLLFTLLISGIGTLVVIYANDYLKGDPRLNRFYAWLFIFMLSMLGVALADNLILLFVFWELTSLSSFLLIGFNHEQPTARAAALQALLVTGAGGLAMLAGLVLLGQVTGTFQISALLEQSQAVQSNSAYLPILILILLGAFTKSAQFPFHFWLPNAMQAPHR